MQAERQGFEGNEEESHEDVAKVAAEDESKEALGAKLPGQGKEGLKPQEEKPDRIEELRRRLRW
jgi:hypothetical protein